MNREEFNLPPGSPMEKTSEMNNFILVFDTETTGLPKNYSASAEDVENWPRIIQLAYSIYEKSGALVKQRVHLIKPNGWVLPTKETFLAEGKSEEEAIKSAAFWTDNGYSMEKLNDQGIDIKDAIAEYVTDRLACGYAVAHNISFDSKIIRAEMIRLGYKTDFTAVKICTMMKSTKHCSIPYPNGRKGIKWPTLTELHNFLFGVPFQGAHDAGKDVEACAKCFFQLIKAGVIQY